MEPVKADFPEWSALKIKPLGIDSAIEVGVTCDCKGACDGAVACDIKVITEFQALGRIDREA